MGDTSIVFLRRKSRRGRRVLASEAFFNEYSNFGGKIRFGNFHSRRRSSPANRLGHLAKQFKARRHGLALGIGPFVAGDAAVPVDRLTVIFGGQENLPGRMIIAGRRGRQTSRHADPQTRRGVDFGPLVRETVGRLGHRRGGRTADRGIGNHADQVGQGTARVGHHGVNKIRRRAGAIKTIADHGGSATGDRERDLKVAERLPFKEVVFHNDEDTKSSVGTGRGPA